MGIYAQLKEFSIASISADTYKIMQSNPRMISKIKIDLRIELGADATDRNQEGLSRIVNSCPVSKSLHPDIEQEVTIDFVSRGWFDLFGVYTGELDRISTVAKNAIVQINRIHSIAYKMYKKV